MCLKWGPRPLTQVLSHEKINGRIMVDPSAFYEARPDTGINLAPSKPRYKAHEGEAPPMTEDQHVLCEHSDVLVLCHRGCLAFMSLVSGFGWRQIDPGVRTR